MFHNFIRNRMTSIDRFYSMFLLLFVMLCLVEVSLELVARGKYISDVVAVDWIRLHEL